MNALVCLVLLLRLSIVTVIVVLAIEPGSWLGVPYLLLHGYSVLRRKTCSVCIILNHGIHETFALLHSSVSTLAMNNIHD